MIVDVVEMHERGAARTLGSHERLPYVLVTTQPLPGHATVTLELVLEDEETGKIGMTISCKPLIPIHNLAKLFELAAEEIRSGRLASVRFG